MYKIPGVVLSVTSCKKGYGRVYLYFGFRRKVSNLVHRLVAKAFLDNSDELPEVNHKNSIRLDNRLENLEWCSKKDNMQHAITQGVRPNWMRGENHYRRVLTDNLVREIRFFWSEGFSSRQIAERLEIKNYLAQNVVNGTKWSHIQ